MKNPNFLILDEPTNDLDIVTLNVLEDYLQNFKGCLIVVSHDRYFMDKVVDHLLVFKGNGILKDFPGNYTDYREWNDLMEEQERENEKKLKQNLFGGLSQKNETNEKNRPKKLTYKEQKELETLEKEIPILENEKREIEIRLGSGEPNSEEMVQLSHRFSELMQLIDEKSFRWLELMENID
jgi:ATP-binding cassette subfamily F protein uup